MSGFRVNRDLPIVCRIADDSLRMVEGLEKASINPDLLVEQAKSKKKALLRSGLRFYTFAR
jgi:hypothetical protein